MVCFGKMYDCMREGTEARFHHNARAYTGNKEQYKEGDKVWCFTSQKFQGKSGKITDAWLGPYTVIDVLSDVMLMVRPSTTEGHDISIHRAEV